MPVSLVLHQKHTLVQNPSRCFRKASKRTTTKTFKTPLSFWFKAHWGKADMEVILLCSVRLPSGVQEKRPWVSTQGSIWSITHNSELKFLAPNCRPGSSLTDAFLGPVRSVVPVTRKLLPFPFLCFQIPDYGLTWSITTHFCWNSGTTDTPKFHICLGSENQDFLAFCQIVCNLLVLVIFFFFQPH